MKLLVVGKGGREHALVTAFAESPSQPEIYCWPGSDAIAALAKPAPGVSDIRSLVAFLQSEGIDLCVAGEESYLMKGLANACLAANLPCWGPVQEAARLEGSKEFAKEFLLRHGIPTGGYRSTATLAEARAAISSYPCVLKFDGLAAGKGVAVCPDEASAEAFLAEVFEQRRFGPGRLLVEEFLQGPEISIFATVCDSEYQILTPARDYKRLKEADEGPNTGGMGAVASRALVDEVMMERIEREIVAPTVAGLVKDRLPYRGFLYFGLMLTKEGPKVIEYNCRFGDPECQAVMPLIRGDLAEYVYQAAQGRLFRDLLRFETGWSVGVVLASAGYPDSARSGDVISGLESVEGARVYHAGTRRNALGQFETCGGRVLAIVAGGETREAAVVKAHGEAAKVRFAGEQRRNDIGVASFS